MTGADLGLRGKMIYDDSSLAPGGFEDAARRPQGPVLNVKDFGAKGDGVADDTPAFRAAAAAAPPGWVTLYGPAGAYNLCPQPGDPVTTQQPVLRINRGGLIFQGEGPGVTTLRFRCLGNTDPATTWRVTGGSYAKISRGGLFNFDWNNASPRGSLSGLQLRSLTLDGGCPFTGDGTVGGDPLTGDGWDISHKALLCNGPVGGVLVHCCEVVNWRGEALYAGGSGRDWLVSNTQVRGCNADAASCSADFTAVNSTFGPDVVNGIENFAAQAGQRTRLLYCLVQCSSDPAHPRGNGAVLIGIPGTSAEVRGCVFQSCGKPILLSEVGHDVTIAGNTLRGCGTGVVTSILGLYKQYPIGFGGLVIDGNASDSPGALLNDQTGGVDGLRVTGNTVTAGRLLAGWFGNAPLPFVVDGNTLGPGCKDAGPYSGARALWTNTTRPPGTASYGLSVNDTNPASTQTLFAPVSDGVSLNDHRTPAGTAHYAVLDATALPLYPPGFTTTLRIGPARRAWVLRADPQTNSLADDTPVPAAGLTLAFDGMRFNPK